MSHEVLESWKPSGAVEDDNGWEREMKARFEDEEMIEGEKGEDLLSKVIRGRMSMTRMRMLLRFSLRILLRMLIRIMIRGLMTRLMMPKFLRRVLRGEVEG